MAPLYLIRKVCSLLASIALVFLSSCELQETDFIRPTPVALDATDITSVSFKASWEPVLGSDIYFIDVSPDPDFVSFVGGFHSFEVQGSSVVVTGLSVEEIYYYRVRAKKGNTISDNSNIISVETGLLPAPVALEPTDLKVFEFVANWSTVDEAVSYLIEVASDSGFTNILSDYNRKEIVGNSVAIEDLDYTETYYYRVVTKRLNKTSSYSNIVKVEPCISKSCKLARIIYSNDYELTFDYNDDLKISDINHFYAPDPSFHNEKWSMHYDADGRLDSITYFYDNYPYVGFKLTYSDGILVSTLSFDNYSLSTIVSDYIYNADKQLIGFRKYDDPSRVNITFYEDYELDEKGNVLKVLNMGGEQTGEFKYDKTFNPKMLIPFEIQPFVLDNFSGYSFRPYHGIYNPVYAAGSFTADDPFFTEQEVFIYDINEKDVAIARKGYYSLQYEFTGCNF
ncbi:fibronectin type III domain-containing protein [Fulvivirga ulvae]|uniref:fibronectin type III domain-containing protein n=1 Tax=Fulvivirga ulvae TaxID=2904245 RepID=UPI001F1D7471|nr:fibronectin type III domain-containing protein [Fulvivirga ulvae]UII33064.1 fibronectin type III domain-containing protein [Fulvivirga ulvae]